MQLPKLQKVSSRPKKKKILLLSDDLRMHSGVGTMSREIVFGTIDKYDWVQIGGAIKHPDNGKIVDMNQAVREETGVEDASLKIYPIDGYGNQELLRQLLIEEKPDAILHYTDPRFWIWLYQMEHEIRQSIPIYYYNIWDNLPYPTWNEPFYESCDLIMNISKQTHNIVQNVCQNKPRTDWDSTYIPHGINEKHFYPIVDEDEIFKVNKLRNELFQGTEVEFCILFINRNIRRKMTSDLIMAFKTFADGLTEDQRKKIGFVLHTEPVDNNGTDLPAVVEELCPDLNVVFSKDKLNNEGMNQLYNAVDLTVNIASNEGFGLGTCESLMCGTPIIVNVTGGLQDQCGFKWNVAPSNMNKQFEYITYQDYKDIHSLHDWRKWENNEDLTHGEWVKPVWPRTRSVQGSVPTPFIMDDRVDWVDVADALRYWYDKSPEERKEAGLLGHEFVTSDDAMMSTRHMSQLFIDHMETAFEKWTPRKSYEVHEV